MKTAVSILESRDLADRADRIRSLIRKSTADMIAAGTELLQAKQDLGHGGFLAWVEQEIHISARTAQLYMSAATLAVGKCEIISLLPPPTVRLLASKSAPTEVVEQVLAAAGSGDIMPERAVRDLIDEKRHAIRNKEAEEERARKLARQPKAERERRERERREHQAELERLKELTRTRARSVFNRFSADDVKFIVNTIDWEVLDELRRLAEGGAA